MLRRPILDYTEAVIHIYLIPCDHDLYYFLIIMNNVLNFVYTVMHEIVCIDKSQAFDVIHSYRIEVKI